MNGWQLPRQAVFGGEVYGLHTDYRDILEIIGWLDDPQLPEFARWDVALTLFYDRPVPREHGREAMEFLTLFLTAGDPPPRYPVPRRISWEQDAQAIVADINKVAGMEIRSRPYIHWWTFLGWFRAVGEGQLSMLVTLRDKLRRGQKLEQWEQEFYRENRDRVRLRPKLTPAEQAQADRA